jgi:hypothetical protein
MAEKKYRKGDRVRFHFGTRFVQGEVKEDRGPIGIKGRHLYLVEFLFGSDASEPSQVELPAVDLQPVEDAITTK